MKTQKIKEIIRIFEDSSIESMDLDTEGVHLSLTRSPQPVIQTAPAVNVQGTAGVRYDTNPDSITAGNEAPVSSTDTAAGSKLDSHGNTDDTDQKPEISGEPVTAPLVGTFYAAASAGDKPFVSTGDHVVEGQPVCIIEAMKVMNEIHAPVNGTVLQCCAENGALVEFGQTLFLIGEDA
ncbi:MAG: acetyl-CoA carboxylase biotin carboxyl carrier protein [Eubacteriaceae bacterium]|jgi:acetyl-CoA carboxylase biotin carboxyl carrier protein